MHRPIFRFEVSGCEEAMIALTEISGNTTWHAFEVIIGRNDKTYIIDTQNDKIIAEEDTPNILNCGEDTPFWITWDGDDSNMIIVGLGEIPIIKSPELDESVYIRYVSLHSTEKLDWKFPDDSGK